MYLSRLYIKNYRSIRELDIPFVRGKNVIVGRNNTGKSNIIKALDLVLGEDSPTYTKSDNFTENDFYSWKEQVGGNTVVKRADECFIWCELRREVGEPLNYDEIYKCAGYFIRAREIDYRVKEADRIPHSRLPHDFAIIIDIDEDNSAARDYVNPKLRNQQTFERQLENKYIFAYAFCARQNDDGTIQRELRFLYREDETKHWVLAYRATIRPQLLQSAIIPSFRDPYNQMRLAHWTWYGRLMRHLTADHVRSEELREAMDTVKNVSDRIFDQVRNEVMTRSIQVAFPGTELHFQFNTDSRVDLYKSCVIYVDDGFKSQLSEKGSGIQSATIIGLFNYYTQHVNTITSALLCIEEPEIYLHPHARRVISDRLDEFLSGNRNQVVLTTHSAEFIRTAAADLSVLLVQKNNAGTSARLVNLREYKDLLMNANFNEVFFAEKVIVCEGNDDHILRAIANALFPGRFDSENVSIISAGGKDRLGRVAELICKLGLKCFVLTDFDYFLRDKSEEADIYGGKRHDSILNLGEGFFKQNCIFGTEGEAIYVEIQKIRSTIKNEQPKEFYTAKKASECAHPNLGAMLDSLRQHGVGVLSGEIEHLSRDGTLMSPSKKLNLDTVFDLYSRVAANVPITDLFEIAEIEELLRAVFER